MSLHEVWEVFTKDMKTHHAVMKSRGFRLSDEVLGVGARWENDAKTTLVVNYDGTRKAQSIRYYVPARSTCAKLVRAEIEAAGFVKDFEKTAPENSKRTYYYEVV
ncbi:hypothetical protein GCM10023185_19750 [Hymenobacter saemangeumensis]|uniref:Uncharacterized protein n=2 Tax=Hymenobacter saemangeumensis TaxID=1084522 RepID=A0ABP8ID98_9BACT